MDKYLEYFREMISLRGLTDHTLSSYCTYIKAYLHYLMDILHKSPEDVSWGELRDYIRWLQKSRTLSDRPIDTFFLSRHIHAHEKRLGWKQRLTCHSFRHAFGTHLYENGTDLLTIKALMGHKSLNSTTIYVHLSAGALRKAISPFDSLAGEYHE